MKQIKPYRFLVLIGFLLLCYFPLFLHLDSLSLRLWDESRRAVNAFEMLHNENLLVPHYESEPDMWGTKPPLLVWLQAGFMAVLGPNELAVRLPSALAGLATVLILVWFGYRQIRLPALGYFAGLALITMFGYLEKPHSVRSGDYDALLTLWLTGGLLFFFSYCLSASNAERRRYLWWTTAFITLGVLTKGIAGLFFMPGLFLFAVYKRKISDLLRERQTYVAIAVFLLVVAAYYLGREQYNPGYLQAVWENELGGRYAESMEGHQHGFFYYFQNFWDRRLTYWLFFIPAGMLLGFVSRGALREMTLLLSINALIFLLVISNSETKLVWYDLPIYPSLALLAAVTPALAFRSIIRRMQISRTILRFGTALLLVVAFCGFPYKRAINTIYMREDRGHQWQHMQYGNFIKKNPEHRNYFLAQSGYNAHTTFYVKVYNERGYGLETIHPDQPLSIEDEILACTQEAKDKIWSKYRVAVIDEFAACQLLRIKGTIEN